ncbi:hypothetical protein WJX81_007048 [Elliptochloris bilobata]|uniref:Uncharacterized protein n=1 Tax=Elliptochloris bilobata TaxID=381761 RepID=A0AAW1S8I5_9CHLO
MIAAPPERCAAGRRAPDPEYVLRGHRADVQALAFHLALDLLYAGDAEGQLFLWDLQQRRPVQEKRLHSAEAGIISLHLLGTAWLLSQGRDGTAMVWRLEADGCVKEGDPVKVLAVGSYNFCRASIALVENRGAEHGPGMDGLPFLLAVAGDDAAILEIWDLQAGRRVATLRQPEGMALSWRWPLTAAGKAA